ncbi:MAG: hypothetical protein PHQ60_12125 [Sideroxydans sp.]|nr:hypothetical protein [Sideroxydans sp.]
MNKYPAILWLILSGCFFSSAVFADPASVNTRSGNEFGVTFSSYRYEEPSAYVSLTGDKFGLSHTGTLVLGNDWYIKDDVRFAYGKVDYSGSGISLGRPDWYCDARALMGRDFQVNSFVLSPYAGFGYRYLFNDSRGYSSTGAIGYRRESNYFYMPMGVTHRIEVQSREVLATTLEFDYLLFGKQVTRLTDVLGYNGYSAISDSTNRQNSGYGFRLSAMYEMDDFSFGPFVNVWHINDSEVVPQAVTHYGVTAIEYLYEPKNQTTEYGVKAAFKF